MVLNDRLSTLGKVRDDGVRRRAFDRSIGVVMMMPNDLSWDVEQLGL